MYSSNVVIRIFSYLINICAVLFTVLRLELCKINFVVITCLDSRCHFCISRVADNDSLTSSRAQLFNGCCNLFGNMRLVNILNLYSKGLSRRIQNPFTL